MLLQARAVCKYYRKGTRAEVRALEGVSVDLPHSSFTVLVGPSGSGKSSLLALLGALDRPTQGQVLIDGRDLAACSDVELTRVRRRMGFIFQDFSLIANLTVEDNITYPLIPQGVVRAERRRRAGEVLSRLALEGKQHVLARELSGGEQQRVAVARALAAEPDILLADEPTSNLDQQTGAALLSLLGQLHSEGKTVAVVSHDPRTLGLATQVIELEQGRLKALRAGSPGMDASGP